MNSVTKKWQEMSNERLMLMQKLSAQHAETAKLKEMLNDAADTLIDNDDYTVQALNSIGHDLKREAAK